MHKEYEPELVFIPEGNFLMGSKVKEDEAPVHRVLVGAFEIGKFQITNKQYSFFTESINYPKPSFWSNPRFARPEQPVVAVNWYDAVAYCDWLTRITGKRFQLPTEAEWEKAARGGLEGKLYPWGDEPPEDQPYYQSRWKNSVPEDVGKYSHNGFGLYNMGDNVHEWCLDWYEPLYYHSSPPINPNGPKEGRRRSSRGGSWRHQIKISRCAARSSLDPSYRYSDYGFRVVGRED